MTSRKRKQKAISTIVRCFVSLNNDKASIISDAACFLVACFCSSVSSHDEVARWFRCLSDDDGGDFWYPKKKSNTSLMTRFIDQVVIFDARRSIK
jgi:hypothetical protein